MKIKYFFICMSLISVLVLTGCVENSTPLHDAEVSFSEMYKDCIMNTDLRLSTSKSSYNSSEDIELPLESISDLSVIFPADQNIRILRFDNDTNKWLEEQNNAQYLPVDAKYIVGKNDPKLEYDYMFVPINPRVDSKTSLRVVLHGNIYTDKIETNKCSGAFVDIIVTP